MGDRNDSLIKCVWLVETIESFKSISAKELKFLWKSSPLSNGNKWTGKLSDYIFNIKDVFKIQIESSNGKTAEYSIISNNLSSSNFPKWCYDTISIRNMVMECEAVKNRILLEDVADDGGLLQLFLDAIKNNKRVGIKYHKYGEEVCSERVIEPYCVKLSKRRWYLLGRNKENEYRVYAFDRIKEANVLDHKFLVDRNFDAEIFFNNYYGVFTHGKPQEVILHVYGEYQNYIKNLKIHPSQKIEKRKDDQEEYSICTLQLSPTPDFLSYLVSCGEFIKVIKPLDLADKVRDALIGIAERYNS